MPETTIPAPSGEREVLKVNIFERVITANAVLMPVFPYLGPGAIVVCGGLVGGGPDALGVGRGGFHHQNTQQEVTVTYGSAGFIRAPGDYAANPDTHANRNFFTATDPADHVALITVVQRQTDADRANQQRESIQFRCAHCGDLLYGFDYTAAPGQRPCHRDEEPAGREDDIVPLFPTLWGTLTGARRFAADPGLRTCAACGHITEPYEYAGVGCHRFVAQHLSANIARRSLLDATDDGK
jgi:hypothetical protein